MAPIRQSNLERRRLRDQCRHKLSQHIYRNLGITIKPSEVRLQPREHDPYVWRLLPERKAILSEIFAKNLSEHSISVYRLICEEVGSTFEAVQSTSPLSSTTVDHIVTISQPQSFSATISQLEEENARLSAELNKWRDKADNEEMKRQLGVKEIQSLLCQQQGFKDEVRHWKDVAVYFRDALKSHTSRLNEIAPAIAKLSKDMTIDWEKRENE